MTDRDITIDDLETAIIIGEELSRNNYAFLNDEDLSYEGGVQEFRTERLAPFCRVLSSAWDYAYDLLGDDATDHLGAFDAEFVPYMMSIFHDVLHNESSNIGSLQTAAELAAIEIAEAGIENRNVDFSFLEG
jgi:hypothetical protein